LLRKRAAGFWRRSPTMSIGSLPSRRRDHRPDELVMLLREILDELRGLHATLRRQAAAVPLADRLLIAVYGIVASDPFTASTLLELADSPLSTRLELRSVVEDIVRGELDHPGAGRKFGKFLAANTQ